VARGDLVCCRWCGRDTRAADELCARCRGTGDGRGQRGRHARHVTQAKDPFDAAEECPHSPRAAERYHGETVRDDL
jgi:hypothetical protein